MQKVEKQLPELVTFPFPSNKVLIFGYGSLMIKDSASRTIKLEAVETMQPALAFGVKRLFNYKITDPSRWGVEQDPKERAMLNIVSNQNLGSMINGVIFEVDREDLNKLISRETGYDLVPILVASWNDVINENSKVEICVAYTFIAKDAHTSCAYYPVLGYLHSIQAAAQEYGADFLAFWNATTYLANGKTTIAEWDGVTFTGILCTQKP